MYLTKFSLPVSTTGAAINLDYSDNIVNGLVYAVQYTVGSVPLPTSSVVTFCIEGASSETYGRPLVKTLTTDNWFYMPRRAVVDSTAATTAWNSTAHVPAPFPVVNARMFTSLVGATSVGGTGTFTIYVEGA